jgi:glycosyltransferase involved in cell wall biosynthesis
MEFTTDVNRIAFLGNYTPRQCGIATYTADVCESIAAAFPETQCLALPMNDRPEGYEYPPQVRFELEQDDVASYLRAADFLNLNEVELLSVQHEYGIYGGEAGEHVLELLRNVKMPVVTTLHTILTDPSPAQRRVLVEVARLSDRLVTMTEKGRQLLLDVYHLPEEKIDLIPHGIPDMAFIDPNFFKDEFDAEGKMVLLTFGLLSPGKGIEYVISALPEILKRHPNVVYIVLGATHPNVKAQNGEAYRNKLKALAASLGVSEQVRFFNQFVSLEELKQFIGAADIYVTPYLNPAQITSGALAYAFGAGKAVISTPYWHAQELLADGRGVLVPFENSGAIAQAVDSMLTNEADRHAMRKRAYLLSREMIWPSTARKYMSSFHMARLQRARRPRRSFALVMLDERSNELPGLKLDHFHAMTDSTGIMQHGIYNVPNFEEGYCTDDNARAYILTVLLDQAGGDANERRLSTIYLSFLWHAFNPSNCRFRNFMSYDRRWLEDQGSEDSHARALWALGTALGRSRDPGHRNIAGRLFAQALPLVVNFTSPRAWAVAILAIHEYLRRFAGDRDANRIRDTLCEKLMDLYRRCASPEWPWFEDVLTYDNAHLSHALILSGHWTSNAEETEIGLRSLRWLLEVQTSASGCFSPVGSNGFYRRGGVCAHFDQQPLEAYAMMSACLEAHRFTRDEFWAQKARMVFEWFLGRNDLGVPLFDSQTGGCRDGLHADRVNQNQGAESTLAYLLGLSEMRLEFAESAGEDADGVAA